jgi:hypothetical protein
MIKFDTINGQLCIMLEKPDAINEFSKTPCVIAGKCGGLKKYYILDFPPSNPSMSMLAEGFEIIGYPVAEGSAEWALYQIRSGKKVAKEGDGEQYCGSFYKNRLFYLNGSGCLVTKNARGLIDPCSEEEFLNLDKTGWKLYEPEPVPQYKVGDWVEYRLDSQAFYGEISEIRDHAYYLSVTTEDIPSDQARAIYLSNIVRKLDPSEVVIHIGCMSGTVRPVSTNGIHIWFHLIDADDKIIATIRIKSLDAPTRELVESLLKAQEEK